MQINKELLTLEFETFKKSIVDLSSKSFVSFDEGLPFEWEAYKSQIRSDAIDRLAVENWTSSLIGTGQILSNVIKAIEIDKNNLLNWQSGRHGGPESRVHHVLHEPGNKVIQLERWFFDFYRGISTPAAAFDQFIKLANRNYSLVAYLYFLKDELSFMPIATTTFDIALARLGYDFKMSHKCSWENYSLYNGALQTVRDGLEIHCEVKNPTLLDAHSFCWMLIDMERELTKPKKIPPSVKQASKGIYITDERQFAIHEMVSNAMGAVRQSGKPTTENITKIKTCTMGDTKLEKYVGKLLDEQQNLCALSGIKMNLMRDDESADRMLYPSLDRIDSQIGYEEGNLQVVCRFLNFWKSSEDDTEFRRLLALVVDQYKDEQGNHKKKAA